MKKDNRAYLSRRLIKWQQAHFQGLPADPKDFQDDSDRWKADLQAAQALQI